MLKSFYVSNYKWKVSIDGQKQPCLEETQRDALGSSAQLLKDVDLWPRPRSVASLCTPRAVSFSPSGCKYFEALSARKLERQMLPMAQPFRCIGFAKGIASSKGFVLGMCLAIYQGPSRPPSRPHHCGWKGHSVLPGNPWRSRLGNPQGGSS